MSFLAYDMTFLGIFVIFLGIFLYVKRKNLKREGILLLYKTSWGIKLIHRVGEKHQNFLKYLGYVSIAVGYLLTAGVIYLVGRIVWIYVFNASFVRAVKIPPVMPLVPYINKIVPNLGLPPFYFTYWIIIIAVVAVFHEFAHGIFAARSKVKIRSTGFGFFPFFLPIFLAAFVEPDEKQIQKKKISEQLAVLSGGTFANLITAIVAFGLLVGFFFLVFVPSGVSFVTYPSAYVTTPSIIAVGNQSFVNPSYQQVLDSMNSKGLNEIKARGGDFLATKNLIEAQNKTPKILKMYYDAPAIKANLQGIITSIDGQRITNYDKLGNVLHEYSPGQTITVTTLLNSSVEKNNTIVLGENPGNSSEAFLGVAFSEQGSNGVLGKLYTILSSFKGSDIYYTSRIGDLGIFIYNLLWWLAIIAVSVALINMLPMGIFDGGRFFYLTILGITKKEKVAKWAYKAMTYLFLAALVVVMAFWIFYIR